MKNGFSQSNTTMLYIQEIISGLTEQEKQETLEKGLKEIFMAMFKK